MSKWENTSKHHFTLHYSNETQITLHFFQGRISAMPEIRADLFLAISMTGMCSLTLSVFFKTFNYFGSQLTKVWKKLILLLFLKLVKILYDSE